VSKSTIRPVGEVLRDLREEAGISQSALAERAGVSASHLSQLEASLRADPRWGTITALTLALGVSLDELGRRCGLPFNGTTKADAGNLAARVGAEIATANRHLEAVSKAQQRVADMVAPRGRKSSR
jgi:HTH-type transcriptional regulator/antitoxin HipB